MAYSEVSVLSPEPPASPARDNPQTGRIIVPAVLIAVALLLLLPHAFSSRWFPKAKQIGLARVYSGDEPHYMVILNSILSDHDLDLANNYTNVHQGGEQAGLAFRGQALDHHTSWVVNGEHVRWPNVFEMDSSRWSYDKNHHPVPKLAEGVSSSFLPSQEYSSHWPGMPLILAPFLFPLTGTTYLEPAAILCSWIATILGMLAFVSLARSLGASTNITLIAVTLTFLGTPVWHYGRTFFTEPYSLACVLGAYALYVGGQRALLAGILCGLGVLMKNSFIVMAFPLGVYMLTRKQWRDALFFAVPIGVAVFATLLLNHMMHGNLFLGPQLWEPGNTVTGAVGLLFSTDHGLITFAPIVISALIGWPAFLRARRGEAVLFLSAFLAIFALIASFFYWHGGFSFGPRQIVPVIPFLMLGLLFRGQQQPLRPWNYADIVVFGLLSLWINFLGAVPYWNYFSAHPLAKLFN
jgi:hypothetical protein